MLVLVKQFDSLDTYSPRANSVFPLLTALQTTKASFFLTLIWDHARVHDLKSRVRFFQAKISLIPVFHLVVWVAVVAPEQHDHEIIVNSSCAPDQNGSSVAAVLSLTVIASFARDNPTKILSSTSRPAVEDELIRMSDPKEEGGKKD